TWAASLDVAGTWQMELYRRKDEAAFSGGLGDREFGHWWKVLQPGESFSAPRAWVTVTDQPVPRAWDRLLESFGEESGPASEEACPVIFNEWCTSWGSPTHKNLIELADRLRGSGVKHLVIDDGWAERPADALLQSNGDWIVNKTAFPEGLEGTVRELREREIDPGIWFEFEVVNPGSAAWSETSHLLHRDGQVLQVGSRRFWDFRDPWVHEYLGEKVVALLRSNGFRYLKVDYNDTIGLGVDGAESPGEGLRQHLEGVVGFFQKLRNELPDLVIENCSSGGHRHSAPFLRTCAMSSFSDAHESVDIPIITANLLPVVPKQKLQVWAVLRKSDNARRLHYSLAATFLGRMCLSGDLHELSTEQWATTQRAIGFYRELAPTFTQGTCQRHGPVLSSYNYPEGWQAVVRTAGDECIVIAHTFANAPKRIEIPCPKGNWQISGIFAEQPEKFLTEADQFVWDCAGDFAGIVARFYKSGC
ncbi:MAG: glycoside hydrolase family 36 protein, partial [Terrimicrobiaceae bacterium]